jgi:hypothetical protein
LTKVIHELVGLFDRLQLPHAIMGGIAVRAHGLPRPTFDVDFVVAVLRDRLAGLFAAIESLGYTVPEQYRGGWIDSVGGGPPGKSGRNSQIPHSSFARLPHVHGDGFPVCLVWRSRSLKPEARAEGMRVVSVEATRIPSACASGFPAAGHDGQRPPPQKTATTRSPGPEGRVNSSGRRPAGQKSHDAMFCLKPAGPGQLQRAEARRAKIARCDVLPEASRFA